MPTALIVDLNNYARYPTLAIGYLIAPLRASGVTVDVLSPLAVGAPPIQHEKEENWREHLVRSINFATHPVMQALHEPLRSIHARWGSHPDQATLAAVSDRLSLNKPDVILLSAYLNHYPAVREVALLAKAQGIPVLLGGPAFSLSETIEEWIDLEGVTAIFAGEADRVICDLVASAIEGRDLAGQTGVWTKGQEDAVIAQPLQDLDELPIPDFSDFPWASYPHPIIPVMTGRGCGWGYCTFCSDVTSSNGRSFRSRSLDAVLDEMVVQSQRHGVKDFIFLDLKMNSNLDVWRGVINNFQRAVPGGRWIATVHVDGKGDNGLDFDTLKAAKEAGLTRISFGLESASQKLIRRMGKGTQVERNQQFIEDAARAGLSLRSTMMMGYPGETCDDLIMTRDFLSHNQLNIDRIRPARFKAIPGTRFEELYRHRPSRFEGLAPVDWNYRLARATYKYEPAVDRGYRQAKKDILQIIHQINRKPLRDNAVQFDGLM